MELSFQTLLNQKASILGMLAFFLTGCVAVQEESSKNDPQILSIEFDCDREEDLWSLRIFADAWTDGGEAVLSTDSRLEVHKIDSIRAAPRGDGDELLLQLAIQADPEDSSSGSKTGFLCTEAQQASLSVRASIFSFEDEEESDCWQWGPEMDFSSLGYSPCAEVDLSEQS